MADPLNNGDRVFDWLGEDSDGTPYYLHPLNLVWSKQGIEHDLEVFRRVAKRLSEDKNYWSALIRDVNWRPTLVGCTCLLVSQERDFLKDLCYRFNLGSMVVPQIAVTIGLLQGKEAGSFFESVLNNEAVRKQPRQAVSAHRVLIRLGYQPQHNIPVDTWRDFDRDDAMISEKIVQQHWDFWSGRL